MAQPRGSLGASTSPSVSPPFPPHPHPNLAEGKVGCGIRTTLTPQDTSHPTSLGIRLLSSLRSEQSITRLQRRAEGSSCPGELAEQTRSSVCNTPAWARSGLNAPPWVQGAGGVRPPYPDVQAPPPPDQRHAQRGALHPGGAPSTPRGGGDDAAI